MNENQTKEEIYVQEEEVQNQIQCLPKVTLRGITTQMIKYQEFWYPIDHNMFRNVVSIQKHFVAKDSDIFITSLPKTGSTWLKSLLFATVNRAKHPINESPLLIHHPQELVYSLETDLYNEAFNYPRPHHLKDLPSPRLLSTHIPYSSLPESIKTSKCRVLYICRNPLDTLVSFYHFISKKIKMGVMVENSNQPCLELKDLFEDFCDGRIVFGPFFEHVLEYWKMSLEQPNKVLFLKYEDLKNDPTLHLKRMAKFIGMPFSSQEENEGVVNQIIELCSIKNMKEVNKNGVINKVFEKKSYFRKGEVGDWTNHFTPTMVERFNKLMHEKLEGYGLSFQLLP